MAEISEVTARLLDYVSYDTQSEDDIVHSQHKEAV